LPGQLMYIFLGGKVLALLSQVAGQERPAKQTHYKGENAVEGYDKEMFHVRQFLIVYRLTESVSFVTVKMLPSGYSSKPPVPCRHGKVPFAAGSPGLPSQEHTLSAMMSTGLRLIFDELMNHFAGPGRRILKQG
jgi:hypothetical protein